MSASVLPETLPVAGTTLILTVNDSPDFLTLLGAILCDEEVRVVTAANGSAALEVLKETRPDLIISDVVMPGINGIELCRKLKANPDTRNIPVLLMTALRCDEADVVEGLRAGADDYIPAYVPIELLRKKVELLVSYHKHVETCGLK
ncbi:MAG TPA: response regulator [Blastocatellia bacterium]|nr:response regulator [Blastocatellia bacterium]